MGVAVRGADLSLSLSLSLSQTHAHTDLSLLSVFVLLSSRMNLAVMEIRVARFRVRRR